MYIKDGICYAGEFVPDIEVSSIKILDDGMLLVEFSTGETRLFDVTSLLDKGSAFAPLSKEENRRTAKVTHGFVVLCHGSMEKLILLQKLYIQKVINIPKKITRFEPFS